MIAQPDNDGWKALARLKANPDMRRVMDWLQSELDDLDIKNRSAQGDAIYRNQGGALTLAMVLDCFDKSVEVARDKR